MQPVDVACPYCGETQTVWLDPMSTGEMTHDCNVCCRPWLLTVYRQPDGTLRASTLRSSGY